MKKNNLIIFGLAVALSSSCSKDKMDNTTISTIEVTEINSSNAESGGVIKSNGNLAILSCGVCWSEIQFPSIDGLNTSYTIDSIDSGTYKSTLSNLNADKTYYTRAYYTNMYDTIYGNQIEFSTPNYIQFNNEIEYGTVTDVDGYIYKTIQIGEQVWMAENLRTIHFRDGTPIEHVTDLDNWWYDMQTKKKSAGFAYYNNNENIKYIHGALYNWVVVSDERNIAPLGWHVSTVEDWQELMKHVDSSTDELETRSRNATRKLRETTTAHWYWDAIYGHPSTNSTGFTSIASGLYEDECMNLGYSAYYWVVNESPSNSGNVNHVSLSTDIDLGYSDPLFLVLSIRCVKD